MYTHNLYPHYIYIYIHTHTHSTCNSYNVQLNTICCNSYNVTNTSDNVSIC